MWVRRTRGSVSGLSCCSRGRGGGRGVGGGVAFTRYLHLFQFVTLQELLAHLVLCGSLGEGHAVSSKNMSVTRVIHTRTNAVIDSAAALVG